MDSNIHRILKKRSNETKKSKELSQRFYSYGFNVAIWKAFFKKDFILKEQKILDFGCGVGFSVYCGIRMGYNVVGLDVKFHGNVYEDINKYRLMYGTYKHIVLYDGFDIPLPDNTFDVIVGKVSFDKFITTKRNDSLEEIKPLINFRLKELKRISTDNALIVSDNFKFITKNDWEKNGFRVKIIDFRKNAEKFYNMKLKWRY
jgi:SAM-dependent methyltransferase